MTNRGEKFPEVCTNEESSFCGTWTEYDDGCEDWEER